MSLATLVNFVQFFFVVVAGLYFWSLLRGQQGNKVAVERESRKEIEKLHRLRAIHLTVPLAERTRPASFADIVGQDDGIRALRAALCGPHPQHVILYGPPGVGKTAAARLVLEEARRNPFSPFGDEARFVEVDATTARFDERGIADPLIGTVHDPIYQGAGPLGMAGIPQPKPGAVTKAHGGILFIDEIGELHPIQMNKLLKVLEDRRVFLESAYYNREDRNIPLHIQDIFENGLPADFRLVGATTRQPEELPPALRSRCLEIFFRGLDAGEVGEIARGAARRAGMDLDAGALAVLTRFARNGREAVNMIQIAAGLAVTEGTGHVTQEQMEWVVSSGRYAPRLEARVTGEAAVGVVNGLAVTGPGSGVVLEVEAVAQPAAGAGSLTVTGVVDEEEMGALGRTVRRRSTARASVENVLTVLRTRAGIDPGRYHLHVNFPGGIPLDGPSAGVAVATAVYSAITGRPVDGGLAMTGELTIRGAVRPVGGVSDKVEAARRAGCRRVLVPRGNWQNRFQHLEGMEVVAVDIWEEVLRWALGEVPAGPVVYAPAPLPAAPATAAPVRPPGWEAGS